MTMDALVKMLSCVEADGRRANHAIVEDEEAKKAPVRSKRAAPLLKKITVSSIAKNELLLLPDAGRGKRGMSPLLSTTSGTDQNRACDGLILRIGEPDEEGVTSIEAGYFDLKSGNPEGYSGQFLSTRCFLTGYVLQLLETFYGKPCKIVRERFVVLHTDQADKVPSLQKKPARPNPKSANTANNADKQVVKNEATLPAYRILS